MKLSKSILNPICATTNGSGAVSLSFLSLRLRRTNNGSGKKSGGGALENPEPTSPKVTCIGQVRVKSKIKAKQCRSLSKRRRGEVSFRRRDQNPQERLRRKNQRWVHLPISACEALRDEFSCLLFPCKITCCVSNGEREKNTNNENENENENGAVLSGEGGRRRREIEVVVGAAEEERIMCGRSSRRHVFDDIEVKNGRIEVKGRSHDVELEVEEEEEEEERARVGICIPPKNALLLMRCRSDPMKMAKREYVIEEESVNFEDKEAVNINCGRVGKETEDDEEEIHNEEAKPNMGIYEEKFVNRGEERTTEDDVLLLLPLPQEEDQKEEYSTHDQEEQKANLQKNQELENSNNQEEEERRAALPECLLLMMCEPKLSTEVSKETWVRSTDFIRWLPAKSAGCDHHQLKRRPTTIEYSKAKPTVPAPPAKKNDRHQLQPPRSSCSLPAGSMIEQNLGAYEPPFALTRCKSEPMRTAAAKLVPAESCLWKNGGTKVEPHGRAALGVGGAGGIRC